jgi:hypothetical protein
LIHRLWPGYKLEKQGQEYMVPCPFCASEKLKCAINPGKGVFQCWVCGERGPTSKFLYHLKDLQVIRQRDIDAIILGSKTPSKLSDLAPMEMPAPPPQEILWTPQRPCVFPPGVFPLYVDEERDKLQNQIYAKSLEYLARRGVGRGDVRKYRLHTCSNFGSPYHGHIFIPCLGQFGRQVTFWTTRSILPNPQPKSYHASSKYSRFSAKSIIMNEHLVTGDTVALCEGPFDAFSIMKNVGIPAIPLLGKTFHALHKTFLEERGVKTVYVCLDPDAVASVNGIVTKISVTPKIVYLQDGDPNDVSAETLRAAFENATLSPRSKFSQLAATFLPEMPQS